MSAGGVCVGPIWLRQRPVSVERRGRGGVIIGLEREVHSKRMADTKGIYHQSLLQTRAQRLESARSRFSFRRRRLESMPKSREGNTGWGRWCKWDVRDKLQSCEHGAVVRGTDGQQLTGARPPPVSAASPSSRLVTALTTAATTVTRCSPSAVSRDSQLSRRTGLVDYY